MKEMKQSKKCEKHPLRKVYSIHKEVRPMKTNLETIQDIVFYMEGHLEERLDLDSLCRVAGYSRYHLSRMFSAVAGFSVHTYIRRRRLTEAARLLVFTDKPVMEIALLAGYETQQSFTVGFKAMYKCSPLAYRRKREFCPLQLTLTVDGSGKLKGDMITDVQMLESGRILLAGYQKNTRLGFFVIGQCWKKMHAGKAGIPNRINTDFLIGLNDYARWDADAEKQPAFSYYAASEVERIGVLPKGMVGRELPAAKYIVFSFRGKREDSMQPAADYIYKEWFPQSTCRLNEDARYDFVRYGEKTEEDGRSRIAYWVPVL